MRKINAFQRHMHPRIIQKGLIKLVMAHWRKSTIYPTKAYTRQKRMEVWGELVSANPDSLSWLVASLRESIDWVTIVRTNSP